MAAPALATKLPKIEPQYSPKRSLNRASPQYEGLSGPSYSITGLKDKFKLPPASILKPGMEHHPGKLDYWPVHALKQAPSNLSLGQAPGSDSSSSQSQGLSGPHSIRGVKPDHTATALTKEYSPIVPKPKFLEQLESYLSKELRLLGCPSYGPHELRLQAHREVFEYLIEDFKTYKPLLSAIKNEYELYLDYQEELIKELEPMRAQLQTVREECERKIVMLREGEKQEESGVQRENKRLQGLLAKMRNEELSYKAQIERLQSEIAGLYEQYRHEVDARKILVADFNDLKYRQQEQKGDESGGGGAEESREDPVVLKLKLTRAREDLRLANQKINTILADYGDVVPRRDYEMLETSYKTLEEEVESLKKNHTSLMQEHNTLQSLYKDTLSQRDSLSSELSKVKRSATPRPDWERCASYIEGGGERWEALSQGRSSDGKVDILLAQIAGVDVSEIRKDDVFQGQGLGEDVPRHLRMEGAVKHRHMTQREANHIINGFWHHRLMSALDSDQTLDESLYVYLLTRNENNESLAIEDAYNVEETCGRFAHEPHMALFTGIVGGEMGEDVFQHWLQIQTALTEAFNQQQQEEGLLSETMLREVLSAQLPAKPEDHLQALHGAAIQVATGPKPSTIDYIKLMTPDGDGRPSEFVSLLLQQYLSESKQFVEEIGQALAEKSEVSPIELQEALRHLDPSKPPEELYLVISKAFSLPLERVGSQLQLEGAEQQGLATPTSKVLQRLNRFGTYRSGPRP